MGKSSGGIRGGMRPKKNNNYGDFSNFYKNYTEEDLEKEKLRLKRDLENGYDDLKKKDIELSSKNLTDLQIKNRREPIINYIKSLKNQLNYLKNNDFKSIENKVYPNLKVGTGVNGNEETWRITTSISGVIGIYPKKFYSKQKAVLEFKKRIDVLKQNNNL